MAGAPYEAGGIRVDDRGDPRRVRRRSSTRLAAARRDEARAAGITDLEIKSGYGLDVDERAALLRGRRAAHRRRHLPRRPRRARRVRAPARRLRRARLRRDARRLRPALPLDRRLLRAGRVRRRPVAAPCSRPAAPPGSGSGSTATSSARARASSSRSSSAPRRSTTAPTSTTPTSRRSPASDTVATFLPATDFSTRQPYPDARRVIDAGATVALATNCNPGSSYTTSMAFCIALAVRDLRMTAERGAARPRRWAAPGRCAATTSAASRPGARADARRPRRTVATRTSSTGPASRWWRRTVIGGTVRHTAR